VRLSPIQLHHGVPEHGQTRRILPHRVDNLIDLLGTERTIRQDRVTNIEIHELSHDLRYLLLCIVSHEPSAAQDGTHRRMKPTET
jgi:hypothetical protein